MKVRMFETLMGMYGNQLYILKKGKNYDLPEDLAENVLNGDDQKAYAYTPDMGELENPFPQHNAPQTKVNGNPLLFEDGKTDRIVLRVNPATKLLLVKLAQLEGTDLTKTILMAAIQKACAEYPSTFTFEEFKLD